MGDFHAPCYVEDIFKLCKGECKILPINIEKEETLRGHLLRTFMALNEHRAHIFEDSIVVGEPAKVMNDIYKLFKIPVPTTLDYTASPGLFDEVNKVGANWLESEDENVDTNNSSCAVLKVTDTIRAKNTWLLCSHG